MGVIEILPAGFNTPQEGVGIYKDAMFIKSESVSKFSEAKFDICIIGAGAAGVALAVELADLPVKTAVLESGYFEFDRETQRLADFDFTDLPLDLNSRVRMYGGSTNVWAGRWKLLDPIDFTPRKWVPYSGWPVSKTDLDFYYKRAAKLLDYPGPKDFDSSLLREDWGLGEFLRPSFFHELRLKKLDFGRAFRGILENPSVSVYLGANVTELISDKTGSSVEAARVETLGGNEFKIRADIFVLACGGIENARLLLLSDSKEGKGLGNKYDQVGRYFMEHPKGKAGLVKLYPEAKRYLWSLRETKWGIVTTGVSPSEAAQKTHGLLNSHVIFAPVYGRSYGEVYEAVLFVLNAIRRKTGLKKIRPRLTAIFRHPFTAVDALVSILAAKLSSKLLRVVRSWLFQKKAIALEVYNFIEQAPDPNNRVVLSEERDKLGYPKAKIQWSIGGLEKRTQETLHRLLKEELRKAGIGELESPLLEKRYDAWPIREDASRHTGTTRMGTDPRFSVVDPDCRVHGIRNLFIAGTSVFPTAGSANPMATVVALSLRLADHLRSTHFAELAPRRKKRVLIVGSGRRVKGAVIPALWGLRDKFEIAAVYSRSIKPLSLLGGRFRMNTVDSLEDIDFSALDLILVSIPVSEVPKLLRLLGPKPTRHITLMLDTPVLNLRDLGYLRRLGRFRKTLVSEDSVTLPPFVLAREVVKSGQIGKVRHIYLFHSGFKYHAVAALKRLVGAAYVRKIRHISLGDGMSIKEFSFPGGANATVLEPSDYSIGRFLIKGSRGSVADYPIAGGRRYTIGYRVKNASYGGLTLNGEERAPDELDAAFLKMAGDDYLPESFMTSLKTRGLMDLIVSATEDGPEGYLPEEGIYDSLIVKIAEKFGYFFDFPLPGGHSLVSRVLRSCSGPRRKALRVSFRRPSSG